MNGTLAQLVWLTSYGNEFIVNGNLPDNNYMENDVFMYNNSVDFYDFKKRWYSSTLKEHICAKNPVEWFKLLKKEKCRFLRLYYKPTGRVVVDGNDYGDERMLAGFVGGGGEWYIETVFDNYSNYWISKQEVTNAEAPDNKIWSYSYARTVGRFSTNNVRYDIADLRKKMEAALINIAAYAKKENMQFWADIFEKALKVLTGEKTDTGYYKMLVDKNYSKETVQLLYAASIAWVFGGMGSWNDTGDNSEEYNNVSNELYSTINLSIVAVANEF